MGVLLQEMETLYEAFSQNKPSPLPDLQIQYSDYAGWQRSWLQGDVLKDEVEYWRDKLHGAPTLLELETDRPRPEHRTMRGAHYPVVFSEEISRALQDFSRQEGATLFMTMMAGFHALLRRCTGQSDVLIGTPIAGRSRVELEPIDRILREHDSDQNELQQRSDFPRVGKTGARIVVRCLHASGLALRQAG